MEKRPIAVAIIGALFLVTGIIGLARVLVESKGLPESDAMWPLGLSAIALVCGLYLFLRRNWARWLAVLWMGAHVAISAFHSVGQMAAHAAFLAAIAYFLFRRQAAGYFA